MKKSLLSWITLSLSILQLQAQTLTWNNYPAGATSFVNGILTATVTSSAPGFQNGTPKYYTGNTVGNGQCGIAGGLALEHMFGNITSAHSTLTLDFTSGNTTSGLCGNISFQIKDINSDESYQTFADWVEISATDGNGNPIPVANIVASGGSNKTITTSGNIRIVKGHSNNAYGSRSSTNCDDVTFSITPPAGTTLKNVILKYHPDYTASPSDYYNFTGPKRPAFQYISISPITVNASAGPTAVNLTSTPASCTGNTGTVTIGTVTGGTSPYTYNFNTTGFGSTTNFTNLAPGNYPVVVLDNAGCSYSTTASVTQVTGPNAVATTPTSASCGQSNGSVTIGNVTGGTAPYQFNFNNLGLSTTTTYSNLSAGTFTLIVQDNAGCSFSTNVTVGTSSGPTAVATTPVSAACGQSNGSVTIGNVTGGTAPYQFNFNNLGLSTTTTYSNLSAGTFTLIVQDNAGCSFSTNITIGTTSGPTAVATTPVSAACGQSNGSVTIGNVTGGTAPYQFNFNNLGLSTTTTYSNLSAGTFTLIVQDNAGCSFSTNVTIGTSSGPSAVTTTPVSAACGQSNGSVTIGNVTGGTAPYQFNFNNLGLSTTTTYSNLSAGTYTLIVQDVAGCSFSTNVVVGSTGNGPTGIVIIPQNETCNQSNGTITLGAVSGGSSPYTFNFNNQGFNSSLNYTNLTAGTYTLIVQDNAGCNYSTNAVVGSVGGPTNIQSTITPASCGQQNGSITLGVVTGGTTPYEYNLNNAGYGTNTVFTNLGAGNYTLIVTDDNGCNYTTSLVVSGTSVGPTAVNLLTIPADCGNPFGTVVVDNVTGGNAPYSFSINGATATQNPTFSNLISGNYSIEVIDNNGCSFTTSTILSESNSDSKVFIPNVFTPNGDAANPTWFIGASCVDQLDCVILNRWGNVIKTFDKITDEWDGTFDGMRVAKGVYFYKATLQFSNGKTETYHGHITVIYE